jgi:hypothetical protein
MEFPYYSYSRKPTGREIFVPAQTLIAVFLLIGIKNETGNKNVWFGKLQAPRLTNMILGH